MVNNNFGFYSASGRFVAVNFPTGNNARPQVDQLLGVNDHDVAVGFYLPRQPPGAGGPSGPPGFTVCRGHAPRPVLMK
jgi:hypothetical protein